MADNLQRAAGAVPADALQQDSQLPGPELAKHLRTLLQGVQMTDSQLTAVRACCSCCASADRTSLVLAAVVFLHAPSIVTWLQIIFR